MKRGICTLGNDYVYDQIVALLNSIQANAGIEMPVCIFPYDNQVDRLRRLAQSRPQVQLYEDSDSIERWDRYIAAIWDTHPTAWQRWKNAGSHGIHRMGTHRRFCAFDGPFEQFVYMDADTLLLSKIEPVFEALNNYDWIIYDFQHKDLSHVFNTDSEYLDKLFSQEQLRQATFCSGFYGTQQGIFSPDLSSEMLKLLRAGESAVLYPMAPDQTILNYLVLRSKLKVCNFAHTLPETERTGNSVTSSHFSVRDGAVFDNGKPLTYLHYIGISSSCFRRLCEGENVNFPYRDIFLRYRYLDAPEKQPVLRGRAQPCPAPPPNRIQRLLRKVGINA